MVDTDNNKTVLIIHKHAIRDGKRNYSHYIGESKFLKKAIEQKLDDSEKIIEAFDSAMKENKEGKFEIGDFIIYVASSEKFPLYAHQYPLVIIKDDKILDVDEWWYTPFKKILEKYQGYYTYDLIDFSKSAHPYDILESALYGKFINNVSTDDVLYGVKTTNITFNMQD